MAAHIRKTNPRNDLGGRGPSGTVNRFRILRRGIPYVSKASQRPTPQLIWKNLEGSP
jgi:deferrochelatase/peroxidase EfeB